MLLEKVNDVCSIGDRVDVHIGMAPLPLTDFVFEALAIAQGEYGGLA